MTDKEIIKGLEVCSNMTDRTISCADCPFDCKYNCCGNLKEAALDLINRLQKQLDDKCDRCIARDRAEAIKEFAEKLKSCVIPQKADADVRELIKYKIDNLVKEMVGAEE